MTGICIEKVSKIFPPKTIALKDINVKIEAGEFFVILGPSGSGKTTLLRIIAGLEMPTSGKVTIGGKTVVDIEKDVYVESKDRNIGMVFQNWALYPHMTVYNNIAFPLKIKGLPKNEIDERIKEVSKALGIHELLERKPSQISGGQQQRVALARALAKHPDVLLLDEPFSNLDARIRVTAREFVKEIQKKLEITSILVTHDQADAFAIGDRVMVLKDGTIQQIGSPKELYSTPENLFIANFIGDPPMNIFSLEIQNEIAYSLKIHEYLHEKETKFFIGIRPDEALASINFKNSHMFGKVIIAEYIGSRKYVKVQINKNISLRVLAEDNVKEGDNVGINVKKLHLFKNNGEKITILDY